MICLSAFFRLSGVLPIDEAISLLKDVITKTYSYKGDIVVRKNHELLDGEYLVCLLYTFYLALFLLINVQSACWCFAVCSDPRYMIEITIPNRWKRAVLTEERRAFTKRHIALIDDEKTRKFMEDSKWRAFFVVFCSSLYEHNEHELTIIRFPYSCRAS